jgi:ABC-type multidrug transport system ATPase subunit
MSYILRTNNLVKKYKNFYALKGVNMNIEKGDVYGFVGENGSGKTTIIRLITGLNTPTKGNDSKRDGFLIRRAAIERNIGVITALDTLRAIADVKVSEIDKKDLEVFNIAE